MQHLVVEVGAVKRGDEVTGRVDANGLTFTYAEARTVTDRRTAVLDETDHVQFVFADGRISSFLPLTERFVVSPAGDATGRA